MPPGRLFVVATPIGNLDDITLRALDTLRAADLVAAEDTRTARKLLDRHRLDRPCVSLHEHSSPARIQELVARMTRGQSLALVSDAGTPGLSDPGAALVEAAIAAGVAVTPIPGAAAFVAAISASGLSMKRVAFEGFLPAKGSERKAALKGLAGERRTLAFYEAPHRIAECLADMAEAFGGGRRACIAREMTKIHEEFERGTLEQLAAAWAKREPKGEFTVLVEGAPEIVAEEPDMEGALRQALKAGKSVSAAAKEVAEALGLPRNRVYQAALAMKHDA